ncbi:restriction endonuclease subunit S [Brevibacillus sp. B_LB10_24]|uniref:restriction endonuclease subunit S n=1 Tax=Brevibacillus sp. B_LB10_24 TaxID=3380645 RepID=UPI0038B7CEA4
MSFEWRIKKIDEIKADIPNAIAMGPFGSNIKTENFVNEGVPIIRGTNLSDGMLYEEDYVFLTEQKADELKSSNAFPRDLIFTHRGTLGQVGIIPLNSKYKRYVVSQSQMKLTCDIKKANPFFVYYFFKSPIGQHALLMNTSTTGVPAISRPVTSLKNIEIPLPSLEEQDRIVNLLSALDNKIELNNAINKILEEIAQALFKRWFVDFEFPNDNGEPYESSGGEFEESELGLIPKGWKLTQLEEVIDINPKSVLKKGECKPYVEMKSIQNNYARVSEYIMREYSSGSKFSYGDVLFARITPCLENGKTAYVDFLNDNEVGWGSTEFIVLRSRPGIPSEFAYFLARSDQFRSHAILSMTGSSGRQRVPESSLRNYRIPLPVTPDLILAFGGVAKSILNLMKRNDDESNRLIQIRDTLLPKLMSGKVRVPVDQESPQATPWQMVAEESEPYNAT